MRDRKINRDRREASFERATKNITVGRMSSRESNLKETEMDEAGTGGYFHHDSDESLMRLKNRQQSVLQDWVMQLPLREQGTLLTAVRGCDDEPKNWISRGVAESPGRRITAYIRWCFMNPADPREVDVPGAFFQSTPPDPFKPSGFGHLPQHWYSHIMHGLEVIAYRHPTEQVRVRATFLYFAMVHNMHLNPESCEQFVKRLSEDRIVTGTVVS
jgi:hypothetical protein